jgi:hypothetical protein
MKTRSTFARLTGLALLIVAATLYYANRSGASGIDQPASTATAIGQTELNPANQISMAMMPPQTGGPVLRGYQRAQAVQMPLAIHGPFVLSAEDAAGKKSERRRPRPEGDGDESGDDNDKNSSPCTNLATCAGKAGGDGPLKNPETPIANIAWDAPTSGGDPQIAAGPNYLVMTLYNQIAFMDKSGKALTQDKNGNPLNGPITTLNFFGKLTDDINAHLNLPAGFPLSQGFGIDTYYDSRVIYDSYRQRYWIAALAYNSKGRRASQMAAGVKVWNPFQSGARRGKLVVAVSSTSDPRDKWNLYWWDSVPNDGQCGGDPMCPMTEHGSDYPSIGISEKYFLEENGANNQQYISIAPADALANGISSIPGGWAFWDIKNPDGSFVSTLQPAVHHGSGFPNWSFFAGNYQNGSQSYQLSMCFLGPLGLYYSATSIKSYSGPANAAQPPTPPSVVLPFPLMMANTGNDVMKAVFRDGKLYSTFQDCKIWPGASQCLTSIRVVRVDVTNPGVPEIDRTFGQRSALDPAKVDLVSYGTPAVEVNKNGDIALVYIRSSAQVFPEARYSVYYAKAPDISPSRALHIGQASVGGDSMPCIRVKGFANCSKPVGNLDVGGISVDGGDDEGIWMAHSYVDSSGNYKTTVGRIFGKRN